MKETNLGIPILLAISIAGIFALPIADTPTSGKEESLNYHSQVNIYKNGDLVESTHNLLTDDGKDWLTNTQLDPNVGSDPGLEFMVLGNGSIPEADDTSHPSKITSCGLSGADITWSSAGTGNITTSHEWTSTCDDQKVNTTGLNATNAYFAGTEFTDVTLQTDDKINVTWHVWVE